jgi:hypothetical protein
VTGALLLDRSVRSRFPLKDRAAAALRREAARLRKIVDATDRLAQILAQLP